MSAPGPALRVLVVDDEDLARARLVTLLADCAAPSARVTGQAGNAPQAMALLQHQVFDLLLLDIRMPGADGLALARALVDVAQPPALVFVTAYAEHAVQAFELEAVDYLTKPVRRERLQQALQKVERALQQRQAERANAVSEDVLLIQDRKRSLRLALAEVLYFKAELKYVTVRTATHSYILDASLNALEERYALQFLRVHRNALAARHAMRALEKHLDPVEGDSWSLQLDGLDERLPVSRRQLALVRDVLAGRA